jgi:hypothetical protein
VGAEKFIFSLFLLLPEISNFQFKKIQNNFFLFSPKFLKYKKFSKKNEIKKKFQKRGERKKFERSEERTRRSGRRIRRRNG